MSIGLENLVNVTGVSSDYPWKDIKDDTGAGDGTPLDQISHSDYHQTFRKLLSIARITPNGQPDNVTNGYQYIDALKKVFKRSNGVINTSVGISFSENQRNKLINVEGASTLTGFLLPNSSLLEDGDSFMFYNNGTFEVVVQGYGSDSIGGTTDVTLNLGGDFVELILDKPNNNWAIANYKYTPTPNPFVINIIEVGSGGGAPAFLNSWIASTPAKFFIDENDVVHLTGAVHKTGSIGGANAIFTLPVGYRPTVDKKWIVPCNDSGTRTFVGVAVAATGQVLVDFLTLTGSTDTYVWLDFEFYKNW